MDHPEQQSQRQTHRSHRMIPATLILIGVLVFGSLPALAHKVTVFAWVEGDQVHTQSKFSGGKKAVGATIRVFDAAGQPLLEGKTDQNGRFQFSKPEVQAINVVLDASSGHRAEWFLPLTSTSKAASAPRDARRAPLEKKHQPLSASQGLPAPASGISEAEIRAIVDEALDRKLAPLFQLLVDSRETGPRLTDVISGIGYIMGLVGVGLYVANRKKAG